jgi:hypothetical protein
MKAIITLRCVLCGKAFRPGNTGGLPNLFGFQMESGNLYNICADCIAYRHDAAIALIQKSEETAFDDHEISGLLDD